MAFSGRGDLFDSLHNGVLRKLSWEGGYHNPRSGGRRRRRLLLLLLLLLLPPAPILDVGRQAFQMTEGNRHNNIGVYIYIIPFLEQQAQRGLLFIFRLSASVSSTPGCEAITTTTTVIVGWM